MGMERRAFTLVELLTVMAILSILAGMFMPVIKSVQGTVVSSVAQRSLGQIQMAAGLYAMDCDDQFPPAMSQLPDGRWQTWFGQQLAEGGFDRKAGTLTSYLKAVLPPDPTHNPRPYLGDLTGYGYNYGFIGSDLRLRGDYSRFPNCENPARGSELQRPSGTITFATSAFYSAPWLPNGDGFKYDFGFFDSPDLWNDNPNVDFRHNLSPVPVEVHGVQIRRGQALFAFADGRTRSMGIERVRQAMFTREGDDGATEPEPSSGGSTGEIGGS